MRGVVRHSPLAVSLAAALALVLTAVAGIGPAAAADEAPRLGLTPVGHDGTFFTLTLEPGASRQLEVEAANFGDTEVRARTYAANVYSIVNGGFGADLFGEEPTGTTTWLDYPTQEMTLGPRDAQVINFDVTVPDDTPPGEYVAALVIENVDPVRGSGSVAIDQVNRSAIAVAIDVPGPRRPALAIGVVGHEVAGERSVVTFDVSNPGNVHLKPTGRFRLVDADGSELSSAELTMDSVYAGTSTILEAPLAGRLPAGEYCAELALSDPETDASAEARCLAFTVADESEADAAAAGGGSRELPLRLPGSDAPLGTATLAVVVVAGAGLFALAIVLALRRRSRGETPDARRATTTRHGRARS